MPVQCECGSHLGPAKSRSRATIWCMERSAQQLSRGYAAVFATVAIWSLPSLFQFYLNRFYDPWSQNFYRYAVACLAIVPFVWFQIRRGGPKIDLRAVGLCLLACLPNTVHQISQVVALFYMGPGVYAIFIRSSVIFTALLALAFFPEDDTSFGNGSSSSERSSDCSAPSA